MKNLTFGLLALATPLLATSAAAHHSFSMFDMSKTVTVTGTVTEYRWRMPHVSIHMALPVAGGKPVQWQGECHSPNIVARKGWKSNMIKAGDKIKVVMHPMRNGSAMGSVVSVHLPDGRIFKND